jgi:chemotaxis protein CheZ
MQLNDISPAPSKPSPANTGLAAIIAGHVQSDLLRELTPLFEDLRRFTDRRIAELSAELHGAVQIVDYSEANLSSQLGNLQNQISSLISAPTAISRNSGLDLESVVVATEAAANRIMEAAETIADWVREGKQDPAAFIAKLDTIFEACAFQDVTGQRIRRAIEHLQHVESVLANAAGASTGVLPPPVPTVESSGADLVQAEIDRLMADF